MPWSYPDDVPAVAQNWTAEEQRLCVDAANAVLEETGDEERAIYACIAAAGKGRKGDSKRVRRYVVAGAPCSGKSTFVREHARPGDLIYDYDDVHRVLSGRAPHDHDPAIRPFVLAARDGIYGELERRSEQAAWVITSTRRTSDLAKLRDRLGAEVILLAIEREEAHRRCDADQRPEAWHEYIDRWFDDGDIEPGAWPMPTIKEGSDKMANRKEFRAPIHLKDDGEEGAFEAVFATFNVVDRDGDVIRPGAFTEGQKVRISAWGHNWNALPVGDGILSADETTSRVKGRFFLDTGGGLETYRTVKNLGPLQEWSFGFDILESSQGEFEGEQVRFLEKLDVYEVSPVMLGAGIGTRTTAIKRVKGAVASHSTPTTDAAWDGPANEARVRSDESASYYRRIYAWRDPEGDEGVKASYRFIHHMISGDGEPGAANIRACQTGIGVLNGARGGTTIPDADRQGVYNHLAKHLRDAGVEPPDLKARANDDADGPEGEAGDGNPSGGEAERVRVLCDLDLDLIEFTTEQ